MSRSNSPVALAYYQQYILPNPIVAAIWNRTMEWWEVEDEVIPFSQEDSFQETLHYLGLDTVILPTTTTSTTTTTSPTHSTSTTHHIPPVADGIKTIVARNLPRDVTTQQITDIFAKYGSIRDIYIPKNMDKSSPYFGTIKGFALIKFAQHAHAAHAFKSEFNKAHITTYKLYLEFAKQDR